MGQIRMESYHGGTSASSAAGGEAVVVWGGGEGLSQVGGGRRTDRPPTATRLHGNGKAPTSRQGAHGLSVWISPIFDELKVGNPLPIQCRFCRISADNNTHTVTHESCVTLKLKGKCSMN